MSSNRFVDVAYGFRFRKALTILTAAFVAFSSTATAQPPQGTVEYYHTDAIGSVRAVTNQQGGLVRQHDYFAFGEEYQAQAGSDSRRFTGKERDPETGLDYFNARYYASAAGRFTGADDSIALTTIGSLRVLPYASIEKPQSFNRFAYAYNNPIRHTDPDGHCPDGCVLEFMAVAAAATATAQAASYLNSPQGQQQMRDIVDSGTQMITTAANWVRSWFASEQKQLTDKAGPTGHISPGEVSGKTPDQIDKRARELGLQPKGPDPKNGKGSYVDPQTGTQRILSHPNANPPHGHVNDANGRRIGSKGMRVPPES